MYFLSGHLLKPSCYYNNITTFIIMWISPNDLISTAIISTATANNTGSPTPDNDSTAENAVQQVPWNTNYTQQIAIERAKDSLTSFRNIRGPASHFKYMLRIAPIIFPAQVAACPPRTETDTILSSEQFLINICDFSGESEFLLSINSLKNSSCSYLLNETRL